MSPNTGPEALQRRRRATREEMEEGARQIMQGHIRMQLEAAREDAAQVPIGSPALGLADEPEMPALEPIPSPRPLEDQQTFDEEIEPKRPAEGVGKGHGQKPLKSAEILGQAPRTPSRVGGSRDVATTPTTPLQRETGAAVP